VTKASARGVEKGAPGDAGFGRSRGTFTPFPLRHEGAPRPKPDRDVSLIAGAMGDPEDGAVAHTMHTGRAPCWNWLA